MNTVNRTLIPNTSMSNLTTRHISREAYLQWLNEDCPESRLSKDKESFSRTASEYTDALKLSGYNKELKYEPNQKKQRNRTRKRKCIYFNAPFCESVKNNIGKEFLRLVNKHFTKSHPLQKIFNRNTIKVSYSCMANMKSIIQGHNSKILNVNEHDERNKPCNCRDKKSCPLQGRCQVRNVIYKATVTSSDGIKHYIWSTGGDFKKRSYNHVSSF